MKKEVTHSLHWPLAIVFLQEPQEIIRKIQHLYLPVPQAQHNIYLVNQLFPKLLLI